VARRDRSLLRTAFPFGPAMLAGALVGLVAGPAIWGHLVG
jgi:leader peptidase (prepilin peptidase)/N-methyltransferase